MNNLGNIFDRFKKNYINPVIVTVFGSASLLQHRSGVQNRAIDKNNRRDARRKELRKEVRSVEEKSTLTEEQKEAQKDNAVVEFTLSSLNDCQPEENVSQDLQITQAIPPDTASLIITIEKELVMGIVPPAILPPVRNTFTVALVNKDGVVRHLNNPLTIALPVQKQYVGKNQQNDGKNQNVGVSSSNTGDGKSGPSEPFASITWSLFRQDKEVSVTILDLKTNKIHTFTNKELLQQPKTNRKINNNQTQNQTQENEVVQQENEVVQKEIFQGVSPNTSSVRFTPQPSTATSVVTTILFIVQLAIVYTFLIPALEVLQSLFKKNVMEKFFKKDQDTEDHLENDNEE